jgi:hypothetical protein
MFQCCHIVLCYEMLGQNRPVCWSIVVKEKSSVGSPYFGTFPSDRIPRATKVVKVQYISLFTVATPVNYTNKFLQIMTANSGNFLKLLREYTNGRDMKQCKKMKNIYKILV